MTKTQKEKVLFRLGLFVGIMLGFSITVAVVWLLFYLP